MHPGGEFSELQTDRFGSSLAAMQYAVDGYIEPVTAYLKQALQLDKGIDVFVNENGLRKGLRPCIFCHDLNSHECFPLVGNLLFTRTDKEGQTQGLSDEDIVKIKSVFLHYPQYAAFEDLLLPFVEFDLSKKNSL